MQKHCSRSIQHNLGNIKWDSILCLLFSGKIVNVKRLLFLYELHSIVHARNSKIYGPEKSFQRKLYTGTTAFTQV